jgi:hypothetical protein
MNTIKTIVTASLLLLGLSVSAQKNYKGAEVYSNQSYKYGKMEMRMRMAKGSGILSTFFTYKNGSEVTGTFWEEIDIEVFGKNNATTIQSNIITNNPRKYSEQVHSPGYSMGDDYHTYTLEWTPNYVAWYIDGVLLRKSEGGQVNDLTNTESFRFNLWASDIVSWVGTFDTGALPAYQFVNWMKYSTYTPGTGNNGTDFTTSWVDDFTTFNTSRWSKANWTFGGNLVDFDPNNVVVKDGYLVLVISAAGQTGFTGTVPVDNKITDVLDNGSLNDGLKVYPNPFKEFINLDTPEAFTYKITDVLGNTVEQSTSKNTNIGAHLSSGIYVLEINIGTQKYFKKIIKE